MADSTMLTRLNHHKNLAKITITDAAFAGQFYYCPGGAYNYAFWPIETVPILTAMPDIFTEAELRTMIDWTLSKQIKNGTTTYTRPKSGGTDTYPLGTVPDNIPTNGTMATANYVPQGDKPFLTNPWGVFYMAYHYGRIRGWDATWKTWFDGGTVKADLTNAFNSVPFNGTTKLVTQYADPYLAGGLYVLAYIRGDDIFSSICAFQSAQFLSEMYTRDGDSATAATWTTKANDLKTGIQGAFKTEPVTKHEIYFEDFSTFIRQAYSYALPGYGFTFAGSAPNSDVIADPQDANKNVYRIRGLAGSTYSFLYNNFYDAGIHNGGADIRIPFRGKIQYVRAVSWVSANMDAMPVRLGVTNQNICLIGFGADGHFKYFNGTVMVNLPTDTTYTADGTGATRYTIEATLNWTTRQFEIFINGVSKGTVNFGHASPTTIDVRLWSHDSAGTGDFYVAEYMDALEPPAETDTGTIGYLPWGGTALSTATAPSFQTIPSLLNTGFAAFAGILTETQMEQGARYLALLVDFPDFIPATPDNRRALVSYMVGGQGYFRWFPWSRDMRKGDEALSAQVIIPANLYGTFINGGYMSWGWHWHFFLLNRHYPSRAWSLIYRVLEGVYLSDTYPAEVVEASVALKGTINNANYFQAAAELFSAWDIVNVSAAGAGGGRIIGSSIIAGVTR